MFAGLWPGFDADEVPISSVTNGVHAPTWVRPRGAASSPSARSAPSSSRRPAAGRASREVPDERDLGDVRRALRAAARRRRAPPAARSRGCSAARATAELGWIDEVLDPDVLTIGFARRVPSYKRLTLMLRDPDRLQALLLDPERPVQIVIAGKAHPADDGGKELIQQIVQFADDPTVRHRIVFLPDYDIGMARTLYPGCDVWLNNPLRPLEACGTSGMKAALNGGLNLSILDGWWDEMYDGENGWAIPTADGVDRPRPPRRPRGRRALRPDREPGRAAVLRPRRRRACRAAGSRWCGTRCRSLGPKVLASRMVRDYVAELYAPGGARPSRALDGDDYAGARELAAWKARVRAAWPACGSTTSRPRASATHPSSAARSRCARSSSLGELTPDDVDGPGRARPGRRVTTSSRDADGRRAAARRGDEGGRHRYEARCRSSGTGPFGYTVRVLPRHRLLADAGRARAW